DVHDDAALEHLGETDLGGDGRLAHVHDSSQMVPMSAGSGAGLTPRRAPRALPSRRAPSASRGGGSEQNVSRVPPADPSSTSLTVLVYTSTPRRCASSNTACGSTESGSHSATPRLGRRHATPRGR